MSHLVPLWLVLAAGLIGPSAQAASVNYPAPPLSVSSLGMGGVEVAVSGRDTAVLTNPAGLIDNRDGWRLVPWAPSIGTTPRTYEFIQDLDSALSRSDEDDQREALFDVIDDYRGIPLHAQWSVRSSLSWRSRFGDHPATLTLARVSGERLDARAHQGFGTEGFLTLDAERLEGLFASAALRSGRWQWGITAKDLHLDRIDDDYTARDLVDIASDDTDLTDLYRHGRSGGLDLGLQTDLTPPLLERARLGVAVQNLGGIDFDEAGRWPQIINLGLIARPSIPGPTAVTLGIDYVDALHRLDLSDNPANRARLGLRWHLIEHPGADLSYSMGLYQGALTLGMGVHWRGVELAAATYAEEQGAYTGQDRERRYLVGFSLAIDESL